GANNKGNTDGQEGTSSGGSGETFVFELAHGGAVPSQFDAAAKKLKEVAEEQSDQRIKINIHPNSELGGEREATESVQGRTVDMAIVSTGPVGNFADKVNALDFPFLFADPDHGRRVLEGEVGEE